MWAKNQSEAPFDKISGTQEGSADTQSQTQTKKRIKPFEDRLKEWIGQQREEEVEKKRLLDWQKATQGLGLQEGEEQIGEIQQQGEQGKQDGKEEGEIQQQGEQGKQDRKQEGKKKVMIKLDAKTQLTPEEYFDLCYKFVSTFSITHYVHSLELGASYYWMMSLVEYSTKLSSKAKLGVSQLADIAIGNERSFNAKKYKSQTTKVGRMNLKVRDDEDD